ncbi:class I SAM-dependent methyltransferase [Chloroflexota bacterium]
MEITHSYNGLGADYLKARKGSPKFASFMVSRASLDGKMPVTLVELGIGSGQQTEFLEEELTVQGITYYKILAYDKSAKQNPDEPPGQLDILKERIKNGEISNNVIPTHFNFDGATFPIEADTVDFVYTGHVVHHIQNKEEVFKEIARITKKSGYFFILGVTLEAMKGHPLDEFFPTKYGYEINRYPPRKQLRELFKNSGFTWERAIRLPHHIARPINRDFLANVEDTTLDSAFKLIRDKDPAAFQEGVERVKREVEKGEKSGTYRTYYSAGQLRIFWGRKV